MKHRVKSALTLSRFYINYFRSSWRRWDAIRQKPSVMTTIMWGGQRVRLFPLHELKDQFNHLRDPALGSALVHLDVKDAEIKRLRAENRALIADNHTLMVQIEMLLGEIPNDCDYIEDELL